VAVTALAMALAASAACSQADDEVGVAASPGARPGGSIVVDVPRPGSIDPSVANDAAGDLIARTICEPLIVFDPVSGAPKPGIADSWIVSDGGRRITVRLRKGVRFHNGQKVTAEDAVRALSRVASQDNASDLASVLEPIIGYEELHGDEESTGRSQPGVLKGLVVNDVHSFEMRLKRPDADFVRVLGQPLASPVPWRLAAKDPDAFARHPVCAGPYEVVGSLAPGQGELAVRRFERYYAKAAVFPRGGAGYLDAIRFRFPPAGGAAASAASAVQGFAEGTADVARISRAERVEALRFGADLVEGPTSEVEYIGLPTRVAPFDNPVVRTALSQALDRKRVVERVFAGGRLPATGFFASTLGALAAAGSCGERTPAAGDVAGAKARLSQAGVDLAGRPVKLYFNDELGNAAVVQEVALQWKEAFGLAVQPVPMGWDKYLALATGAGGFDGAFRTSWRPEFPSADRAVYPLLGSSAIGKSNFSRHSDISFDRLVEDSARRTSSDADRQLDYLKAARLSCETMPMIPVAFGQTHFLVRTARLGAAGGHLTDRVSGQVLLRELFVK
jgi:ABC-type transport system substrate-binding protein